MKKKRPAAYAGQQQPRIRRRLVGTTAQASGEAVAKTGATTRREAVGWLGE